MKKIIIMLLSVLLAIGMLTGCSEKEVKPVSENNKKTISIVTTIFPEYDWVKNIVEGVDGIEVKLLLDKGVDLHSYQPTADDIIKVATCDLFIYVGGESDEWVDDALAEAVNKDMKVINLLEELGEKVKEEELVEGMEAEEEEEEAEESEKEVEYDEHVWLSLNNASELCTVIFETLCEIDKDNADTYKANLNSYISKLEELNNEYVKTVNESEKDTLLFADRFPFRYLVDDYGLNYYAAFAGCSAETEASFETIIFLANKVDELGLKAIMQIESADGKIAETIRNNSSSKDQKILTMDSMQSVTARDVSKGADYLSIMNANLDILKEALN